MEQLEELQKENENLKIRIIELEFTICHIKDHMAKAIQEIDLLKVDTSNYNEYKITQNFR